MREYDHKAIEEKWKKRWSEANLYATSESADKPKCYVLDMFPYPSGEGLHVGHPKGYIATDVYSRFQKMSGKEVLHPMGWDAFGLPAENYAIKNKIHPRLAVEKNIKRYKEQLGNIGFNYDWGREIDTTDPAFYKWTQWIFLKLFEKGLAYESYEPINWCPSCQTGLANEDLEQGKCERCGSIVEKRPMRQWVLRITDYAERLLADLDQLAWPEYIKESQRNWIGKSEGAEIDFPLVFQKHPEDNDNRGPNGEKAQLTVFTTRPDTLFGATYLAIAPEHLWMRLALDDAHDVFFNTDEVRAYVDAAKNKPEIERTAVGKEKTGVRLEGVMAVNPATQEQIPIYVADYVLGSYGTGAVMAVPAHDERDWEFAKKFDLPTKQVIEPLFVDAKEPSAYRANEPVVERNGIAAVVKHWKEDRYMCLAWKKVAWHTWITGGIEEGQTPEEAARMEIKEETGFQSLILKKNLGKFHSLFYHNPKGENRLLHADILYFELADDSRVDVSAEEQTKHDLQWYSLEELKNVLTAASHQYVCSVFEQAAIYTGAGMLTGSGSFNGLASEEAKKKITEYVSGRWVTKYKLRDWVFSRQRYWGEPIPLIHCEKDGVVPVSESELPVRLPDVEHYEPSGTGESPLATITEWVNTTCPKCGGLARRETNTMPQWAGSSWYYLRFIDPHNDKVLVDKEKEAYWSPVDMYVGGAEHATRHLIYARFWHKFLLDIGSVSYSEPFTNLKSVGLILGEDGRKMGKRYGNGINPDDIVGKFGADALRAYEMFMGPFDQAVAWSTNGLVGVRRFLERVVKLSEKVDEKTADAEEVQVLMHQTIKKVGEDIEEFRMNTAVSQLMIFSNLLEKQETISRTAYEMLLVLLAPLAPFVTEELWEVLGNKESIHQQPWPLFDSTKLTGSEVTIAVQINGKVRGTVVCSTDASEATVLALARSEAKIAPWLEKGSISKVFYVPQKLMNILITEA